MHHTSKEYISFLANNISDQVGGVLQKDWLQHNVILSWVQHAAGVSGAFSHKSETHV